ncbi:MAG: hypothetical protein ACQEVT_11940 [Pseudomonadota bacterium]|uniref:hypothetical protein n=1 Tax=Roseovarius TaxID=74030 RepID=UPI0022A6A979|nr:hypothetical protein [Roseovarius sp. EGI FJ00037]MCZ0810944.1 hypothetical protein [Roseovarius sp. EGI FJ00037]
MHDPRRIFLAPLAALLALAACSPPALYHKPGATVAQLDRDETACQVAALRQVPEQIRTRYTPPEYRMEPICFANGACTWRRVQIRAAQYERYDANQGLRARVARQCMADRGYARIELPACDGAVAGNVTIHSDDPLPVLDETSCAVRTKAGNWRVHNPAR